MNFFPLIIFFFLGTVAASFATVIAERVHTGESWVRGRSKCNSCGRVLKGLDLVPIFSWLLTFGRCRTCRSRIPASYVFGEAVLGILFALGFSKLGLTLALLAYLLVLVILGFVVLYDLRHTIVPPQASLALVVSCLAFAYMVAPSVVMFGTALLAAGVIGLGLFSMHAFSGGKAMGLADAPVAFALSLLAAPYALAGILFSFWIGAVWGIGMLVMRRGGPRMGIEVPFVPFLAAGFLIAYFLQWNPLTW